MSRSVDHVTVAAVACKNSAHITNVMHQASDDEMRVVLRRHMGVQRSPSYNVMPRERDQHRMLDIMIERVAVADALECNASNGRYNLEQMPGRRAISALDAGSQKVAERI